MISNKGLLTINAFMSSCDDLINGKFIFAGNKVSNILKAINESPELYEVISECLKEFNYEKEFGRAKVKLPTKKGTFKMPEEYTSKIPLVFCMLVEIQENKIDFKQFLADYFDTDDEKSQFENFAEQVIIPFKNAIAYLFDIEGQNKYKKEVEEPKKETILTKTEEPKKEVTSKTSKYFEDVKAIVDDITNDVEYIKIKQEIYDDILYMADCVKSAIEKQDVKMVNSLVIGFCYILKQARKLRYYEGEFRNAMEELYL